MTVALRPAVWLPAASVLLGCSSGWLAAVNEDGDRIPVRVVENLRRPDSTQTPVTIETASINGDTLHLRLKYAGGCTRHDFGLEGSSHLDASDPPEVTVVLQHDGHGDTCRAGLTPNVIAELDPLREIAGEHTTVRIRLYEPWALAPVDQVLIYSVPDIPNPRRKS